MAAGRIINSVICKDKKVSELSDDTSRLAFTWLITFADRDGKTFGDPAIVRSMVFPRRDDFTNSQMEAYIAEWHKAGMIIWYEILGDKYILFPNFKKNQPNLRVDRETPSIIPDPPDYCRSSDGVLPSECPVKLTEVKLSEDKITEDNNQLLSNFTLYEQLIGQITPPVADAITLAESTYPLEWIPEALNLAAIQNKRSWAYAAGILKSWNENGKDNIRPKKKDNRDWGLEGIHFDNL